MRYELCFYDVVLVGRAVLERLEKMGEPQELKPLSWRPFFGEILLKVETSEHEYRQILVEKNKGNDFNITIFEQDSEDGLTFSTQYKDSGGSCSIQDKTMPDLTDEQKRVLGLIERAHTALHEGELKLLQVSWMNEKSKIRRQIRGQKNEIGEWVDFMIDNEKSSRNTHEVAVYVIK